jgi:DNA polymerase-3 subunit alpha
MAILGREMSRLGLVMKSPDINRSNVDFSVETANEIRYGLAGIHGLGKELVQSIVAERERSGYFFDLEDFISRMVKVGKITSAQIKNMIRSGAFDSIEPNRKMAMASIPWLLAKAKKKGKRQIELIKTDAVVEDVEDFSQGEKMNDERKMTGFYFSSTIHSIAEIPQEIIMKRQTIDMAIRRQDACYIVGVVRHFRTFQREDGKERYYFSLEDDKDGVDCIVYEYDVDKLEEQIEEGKLMILYGKYAEKQRTKDGEKDFHRFKVSRSVKTKEKIFL